MAFGGKSIEIDEILDVVETDGNRVLIVRAKDGLIYNVPEPKKEEAEPEDEETEDEEAEEEPSDEEEADEEPEEEEPEEDEMTEEEQKQKDLKEIEEQLDDFKKDVLDKLEDSVRGDIQELGTIEVVSDDISEYHARPETASIRYRLRRSLSKLKEELNNRMLRDLRSGQLSISSVIKERASGIRTGKIFQKKIAPKPEEARLGVVIIVDGSGSMENIESFFGKAEKRILIAKEAAWAISGAVEDSGGYCAVLVFRSPGGAAEQVRLIKDFRKRGLWNTVGTPDGGTNIFKALVNGEQLLMRLRQTYNVNNLVMIMVTDGGWTDTEASLPKMLDIKRKGLIITVEILVGKDVDPVFHGGNFRLAVPNFEDLPQRIEEVIVQIQRGVAQKVLRGG